MRLLHNTRNRRTLVDREFIPCSLAQEVYLQPDEFADVLKRIIAWKMTDFCNSRIFSLLQGILPPRRSARNSLLTATFPARRLRDLRPNSTWAIVKDSSMSAWPQTLVLIGAGKMGGAMLRGWLAGGLPGRRGSR
jgi:hypothetical protein